MQWYSERVYIQMGDDTEYVGNGEQSLSPVVVMLLAELVRTPTRRQKKNIICVVRVIYGNDQIE